MLEKTSLGIVGGRSVGNDEWPVGALGEQQLARGLGQGMMAGRVIQGGRRHSPESLLYRTQAPPYPRCLRIPPHAEVALGTPAPLRERDLFLWRCMLERCTRGAGPDPGRARECLIQRPEKERPFGPPMAEELGIEWRDDRSRRH